MLLDGLLYRRAGRMVGISKTEVGDSMELLLGPLADRGFCQPDGTFITTLDEPSERLGELAEVGEAVCVDGSATRVQPGHEDGPTKGAVRRQAARRQGLSVSTIWVTCCGWTAAGRAGWLTDVDTVDHLTVGSWPSRTTNHHDADAAPAG